MGLFFKAVVQAVLFFRAETWFLPPHMERSLGSFHCSFVQRLTRRQLRRRGGGRWEYPPLAAVMEEAGFEEIGVYIIRSQNTFAQYITTRPILDLCERSVCRTGA